MRSGERPKFASLTLYIDLGLSKQLTLVDRPSSRKKMKKAFYLFFTFFFLDFFFSVISELLPSKSKDATDPTLELLVDPDCSFFVQ